jgi:NADH:ubiquinone oxidoreductase subunit 3 (subunit A)
MLYDYIALAVFAVLALLVPLALITVSKLIARRSPGNPIKNAPWESGEASIGRARDIENEYLPFFSLFLPFEVVAGILLAWATVAYGLSFSVDLGMIVLAIASGGAAWFGYRTIVG